MLYQISALFDPLWHVLQSIYQTYYAILLKCYNNHYPNEEVVMLGRDWGRGIFAIIQMTSYER